MDGNRSARLTLVALFGVALFLGACSSSQSEADDGVIGLESPTTTSTSAVVIGDDSAMEDPSTSSEDGLAEVPTTDSEENGVGEGDNNTATTVDSEQDATSTTTMASNNTPLVDQDDLVACAKVEVGYLFLLDGEPVQATPFLEEGAAHSVQSADPDYSAAAVALAAATPGSEALSAADAFLLVCEADGFERLA